MSASESALNTGPVWLRLLSVSAPMSVGILSVLSVGLADAFFLARVGEAELAAVGFVYPITVALTAFAIGISAGANAALSQALGAERDARAVARLALHALILGTVIGLILAAALWSRAEALFSMLGAEEAVLHAVLDYIPFWALSFPVLIATMVLEATFRASGDGVTPAATMVLTAVLNVAITPTLAFGVGPIPALGMAGAGIATLVARSIALALALYLAVHWSRLSTGWRFATGWWSSVRDIASIGLPAATARGINPAATAIVTAFVAGLGDSFVAGYGAAGRVQAIAMVPYMALASGISPVIGQAWGGALKRRAQTAMRVSLTFVALYGAGLATVLWLYADPLALLMTDSGSSAGYAAEYLSIVGLSLGFYGVLLVTNAALTARSRAGAALSLSLARIAGLFIPLSWLGIIWLGYSGMVAATVLANVLAAVGAVILMSRNGLLSFGTGQHEAHAEREPKGTSS